MCFQINATDKNPVKPANPAKDIINSLQVKEPVKAANPAVDIINSLHKEPTRKTADTASDLINSLTLLGNQLGKSKLPESDEANEKSSTTHPLDHIHEIVKPAMDIINSLVFPKPNSLTTQKTATGLCKETLHGS